MATVALTTTPATLDSGNSEFVTVTNTGSTEARVSRGPSEVARLQPTQSVTVYPEGSAVTGLVVSGSGQVSTSAQAARVSAAQQYAADPAFTATYGQLAGPNTWTGTQNFAGATVTGIAGGGVTTGVPTVVNVKDATYGAKGDGKDITDAAITSGAAALSSATAGFTSGDVGKVVYVIGAGTSGGLLSTTIQAYVSGTQVTLAANAATTVSGAAAAFGTNDATAINAAVTAAKAAGGGGVVYFPSGVYLTASTLTSMDSTVSVTLRGPLTSKNMFFASGYGTSTRAELRYTGGGSTAFISARATESFAVEGLAVRYMSPAFTGHLVDAGYSGRQSFNFTARDVLLSGFGTTAVNAASLVNCDGAVEFVFDNTSFENSTLGVLGRNAITWSNAVFFNHCHFAGLTTTALNPYSHWTFSGCTFETASMNQTGAASPIKSADDAHACAGITFIGCGWWDGSSGTWIDLRGSGVTIIGGYWEPQGGTSESLVTVRTTSGLPNFDGLTIRGLRASAANNSSNASTLVKWQRTLATDTLTNIDVAGNSLGSVSGTTAAPIDGLDAMTGNLSMAGLHSQNTLKDFGNGGSAVTLTRAAAQRITLSAASCAVTLPSVGSDVRTRLDVYLVQDGTGSRAVTWPTNVSWAGGSAPTLTTTAGKTDIVRLETVTGGTIWIGTVVGQNVASANLPGQPTGLTATAGSGQAAVAWTAPASNGGSALTDYVVQYRTSAGPGSWNTFADGTSTTTAATVTGLTNGTGYDFQVAAVNIVGAGSYSSTASATPAAGIFNPLSDVTWTAAYYAGDTAWTNPGNGNAVSSWRDGSGNSRTLTQATGSKQPTYTAVDASLNNKPSVVFNKTNSQILFSPSFSQNQTFSVVIIASNLQGSANGDRALSSVTGNNVQILTGATNYQVYAGAGPAGAGVNTPTATIVAVTFAGASSRTAYGTQVFTNQNIGTNGIAGGIAIGGRGDNSLFASFNAGFIGVYAGDITADGNWTAFKTWANTTYGVTAG